MRAFITQQRMSWLIAAMSVLVAVIAAGSSGAASIPSGQRVLGKSLLQPVYNDENAGEIGYILKPTSAPQPLPANPVAWAPFYLVVYPVGSTAATTYLCMHLPVDNCPTDGPGIASLAQAMEPEVYGAGVAGRDHLMDFPGGSDFNIAWEPIFVLFTPQGAADGAINEHVLTDAQIDALVANGDAKVFPRPTRTFICASVPARLYDMATPLVP
jgi:hypothetical protein